MVCNKSGKDLKGDVGTVKVRSGRKEGHTGENGIGSPTRKGLQILLELLKSEAYPSVPKRTRKDKTHNAEEEIRVMRVQ